MTNDITLLTIWLTSPVVVYLSVKLGTFAFFIGRARALNYLLEKSKHGKSE